jgi:hypothetical protein
METRRLRNRMEMRTLEMTCERLAMMSRYRVLLSVIVSVLFPDSDVKFELLFILASDPVSLAE